ncbi:prolipoprotein diacylglyceryl transferase [Trichothermofontia sichuanensis B231]|uniref:prolipoprotein diacylglyceryl transferase n=1 Tax=Trichothermofontia sichuanensis TaxID=3045816 RepID=UPI0022480C13|nr:prolipoprotein diacylglyceryl transferase [Trichothermofontia sichuanensis]UZQ56201.1 prolipoprotein diacylglyceryl transferase [Trichothermofontia sichuanensis B231]
MLWSVLPLAFRFESPGPILVELGPLAVRWYGLLIATAVLIGVTLSQWLAKQRRVDPEAIADLALWLVVGAIPAARLYYVLFQWREYAAEPLQAFAIWKGGIAIHGAILGGTIATILFCRIRKLSFWQIADLIAPSLILGQAIGRWGNFFNSEAFGRPTDLPWKLYIPLDHRPLAYRSFEYFHPTFLYESLWNLGVFGLLMGIFLWDSRQPQPRCKPGTLFLTYWLAYSLGRFWIEGLRTDSLMLGPLRIAQVVSLLGIVLGGLGLWWLYGRRRSLPDTIADSAWSYNQLPPQRESH